MKSKKRASRARPALYSEVVADHIRFGRVLNTYGNTVVVNFEVPGWPFPMLERRDRSEVTLIDQMPDLAFAEEAPF